MDPLVHTRISFENEHNISIRRTTPGLDLRLQNSIEYGGLILADAVKDTYVLVEGRKEVLPVPHKVY